MCVIVLTPQQTAEDARKQLLNATEKLAEAQTAILKALATLDMFEQNFRQGHYVQKETPHPDVAQWVGGDDN